MFSWIALKEFYPVKPTLHGNSRRRHLCRTKRFHKERGVFIWVWAAKGKQNELRKGSAVDRRDGVPQGGQFNVPHDARRLETRVWEIWRGRGCLHPSWSLHPRKSRLCLCEVSWNQVRPIKCSHVKRRSRSGSRSASISNKLPQIVSAESVFGFLRSNRSMDVRRNESCERVCWRFGWENWTGIHSSQSVLRSKKFPCAWNWTTARIRWI